MIALDRLTIILRRATLLFVSLPLFIFFFGWLRLGYALLVCLPLGAAIWRLMSRKASETPLPVATRECLSVLELSVAILLPAAVLTFLCGTGGWGAGDSDWLKHDTLLHDLIARPWPVKYATANGPILLVYYLAYYLPAAVFGKLTGAAGQFVGSQVLVLTTLVGIVLSALWLIVLGHSSRFAREVLPTTRHCRVRAEIWVGAVVFFLFSGSDVLGKMMVNAYLKLPLFYGDWSDIEWWAQFAQYSSNAATVFWAPQHAFGGWLPTALLLHEWFSSTRWEGSFILYFAFALVWSPFAALGLAALAGGMHVWRWLQSYGMGHIVSTEETSDLRPWLSLVNMAGLLAAGFFSVFLLAHFQNFPLPAAFQITPGHHPMPLLEESHVPLLALYTAFIVVEFFGFSIALAIFFRRAGEARDAAAVYSGRFERQMLVISTLVLLALPLFRYGFANDLVMRGAIPALFALQAILTRMFALTCRTDQHDQVTRFQRLAVNLAFLLLAAGAVNVGIEYRRHIQHMIAQHDWRDTRSREPVRTLAELQRTVYARPGFDFARQYLGSDESFFSRYLARRAAPPSAVRGQEVDF